jgi:replicative DNA helicase
MNETGLLMERLKSRELTLDNVLYPGKYLHEADPTTLEIEVLPSGFDVFDRYMLLKKSEGELIVVAGEASMGKSSLMLKLAFNVAKQGFVHIFSLEDSYEQIVRRRISGLIGRPIDAIMRGLCRDQIPGAVEELRSWKFFVDDTGALTIDEICDRARSQHRRTKTALIAVDHLQVMGMDPKHSRALEIGHATYKLKALAKELKCPVLLASQMNRQYAGRDDKRPRLSDLKESSSIEQNADIVVSVFREYRYTKLRPGEADIGILKNRNGATGEFVLGFAPAQADFYETDKTVYDLPVSREEDEV